MVIYLVDYWVCSGSLEAWLQGYEHMRKNGKEKGIVWAVERKAETSASDLVAFYVTAPVKGIIGFGKVTKTHLRKRNQVIWNDEPRIRSKFTIEMEILWLAPSIFESYIRLEENPWIAGYNRRGLNHIASE